VVPGAFCPGTTSFSVSCLLLGLRQGVGQFDVLCLFLAAPNFFAVITGMFPYRREDMRTVSQYFFSSRLKPDLNVLKVAPLFTSARVLPHVVRPYFLVCLFISSFR
jgi:hypothetical protein